MSKEISYASSDVPDDYKCKDCGARGCKLWRLYNTFLDHQELRCATCAVKDQEITSAEAVVGDDGRRETPYGRTDQIGWLIPAVPTEDGETFWGYTSVPMPGVEWWRRLPTRLP